MPFRLRTHGLGFESDELRRTGGILCAEPRANPDYMRTKSKKGYRRSGVVSVEKVGFSARLNSGTTTTGEPIRHIEWFFGPSVTFAALLSG